MENTIIENNTVKVLFTERICCFDNDFIIIKYKFNEGTTLCIKLKFNYTAEKSSRFINRKEENGILVFNLFNFDSPLGVGLKKPIEIAQYKNKKIYFLFNVFKFKDSNPTLDFTLYTQK